MRAKTLLDKKSVERTITRMAHEIIERNHGSQGLNLIGIRTRGIHVAERLRERIKEIEGSEIALGILDITMYRDDIFKLKSPAVKKTEIPFDLNNRTIVLVDDVLHTGRTIRAAIDAIMDLGRPQKIQLAVLVDRGERELPIHPDYAGLTYIVHADEEILVRMREVDDKDAVVIVKKR
jgi:pyrimidine operon attenuation protein / uracil phosphoribosyltransferase